ncbi:DUF4391 domain-containing protein [Bifidobacterium callitrichos]|uniref:DUF4391 domain-containing protein n=1 Tax=Bifidobacterium callitrichos TaxID=762209 RepID=A0A5M9ZE95_9BIFI|nr:DUF4391 domain-containing protein [Bifidobacterium callitrichos]KAA8817461.1 DUF4391 domain-containing protein [Bifidobacterium callitrichos]
MMPVAVAHCGSVSALTLGLPTSMAVPEAKGVLPKAMFLKLPISAKLKQRLNTEVESITMLALMRPANTGLEADGGRIPEVLVIGLKLTGKTDVVPAEIVELISSIRSKSGIVFVCVRDVPFEGATREECAFAVRRAVPVKPGRPAVAKVYAGQWMPAGEAQLEIGVAEAAGAEAVPRTMDALWHSLCAQAVLGDADGADLDARIARRDLLARLKADESKLSRDHQRAKNPAQRNEIYAKLHKVRAQIAQMEE